VKNACGGEETGGLVSGMAQLNVRPTVPKGWTWTPVSWVAQPLLISEHAGFGVSACAKLGIGFVAVDAGDGFVRVWVN
jgi:hypothetical protein